MSGWIKIHRPIKEHWIWQDPIKFRWWITMLLEVNYLEGKLILGNNIHVVKTGQSAKSIRSWASCFGCGTKSVINFFNLLENEKMISKEIIGKGKQSTTLINITNYSDYQCIEETQGKRKGNAKGGTIEESNKEIINWSELIKHFNDITGKGTRVIPQKVKDAFKLRIKEGFSKDDIANAIFNCYNDPYHKENNHKYLTLEFISRSDKLERYSTFKPKKSA